MPRYEYNCRRCGQHFEVRQKFADEPLKVHEDCGGDVERLVSVPMLQFKGTGWYVTDYAKSGKSPSANGSNGHPESKSETKTEAAKTEAKSDTKSESKSESKTEKKPAPANT